MKAVGYVRVSTEEQADSGDGLEVQRAAITTEAQRRGFELVAVHEDVVASGKALSGRPGLGEALSAVDEGQAAVLIVAKLDRLSRSLLDFSELMERSRRRGWALIALDIAIDTSTPSGEMLANVLAVFAQFERGLIGERTREALAIKRSQGVQLGRPRTLPDDIRERIVTERHSGSSLPAIAAKLNAEGVPTAQGGRRWYPSTVRTVAEQSPAGSRNDRNSTAAAVGRGHG